MNLIAPVNDISKIYSQKSHFIIKPHFIGGYTLEIKRRGCALETLYCATEAIANRARLKLSRDSLIGYKVD